ncbi:pollen-specific leucine-rich repeat extensin-like protein 1 [Arachis duranensis]|uniref:Pollen-specific leucine-rich repeat extensin-like protein 1 n=1 Tax=Arachis duranensis TaxID=130453 RepID=A0A6P4CK73_ARADU|nr:pollen-specific leucine-rich repeat extensin-like protein 1 [Arachis duranensis]
MVDVFVVPVFHHGGSFVRTSDGTRIYQNGKVEKFPEMDLDFVNFGDLITLFKGLGYQSYNAVYWYDPTSADVESGLHILTGDAGINAMHENKMKNAQTNEFYLYFDHPVDEHEIVEDGGNKSKGKSPMLEEVQSSSSDDGYESMEDEPYKPPPPGFESESDDSAADRVGKRKRVSKTKENIVSPSKASRKKPAAKKTGPVPSQEFWTRTEYSRPDPPIIKRPIGRPKVHNRQKDPAEPMMQQGEKLKRSFKDAPSTQDHSIPTQPPMPDVTPGHSNPVAATAVAPQVKPGPVTRRTHFRPLLQVPSTTHQNAQATQSEMRPKQRIFRPPAPLNPSPLPPQSQPNPPGPHPPQVILGPNAAATQETLAPTSTTTTGMFKFIPNPPSIVPKK